MVVVSKTVIRVLRSGSSAAPYLPANHSSLRSHCHRFAGVTGSERLHLSIPSRLKCAYARCTARTAHACNLGVVIVVGWFLVPVISHSIHLSALFSYFLPQSKTCRKFQPDLVAAVIWTVEWQDEKMDDEMPFVSLSKNVGTGSNPLRANDSLRPASPTLRCLPDRRSAVNYRYETCDRQITPHAMCLREPT
ncbi:hypothetical protein GMOD_00002538 [Pyrenophora seminiperda CCB06]|uniref:Uncharacterized protein n=1 Tax=Pyrenophora seminiperda CCB06 TaxID=1302712 RepID=A0A3M7M2L6_9PLEO|nr:hypothetical protein GMOD_00002538 [Pyrenophora seminiperda CCB06]